jgi:hypothetical protein
MRQGEFLMDMQRGRKPQLTFAIYEGNAPVRRAEVNGDIVKIGNDPKSHLRLAGDVARMHALVEVAATGEMTLIDLGSEPGTLVNGMRVNKCKLSIGDAVKIGSTKFVLETFAYNESASPFAEALPQGVVSPFSPFANAPAIESVSAASDGYAMIKNGPSPSDEEVESHVSAVEVKIAWDTNVLHVAHLSPARSFIRSAQRVCRWSSFAMERHAS